MQFGYILQHYGSQITAENIRANTILAEDLGFNSLWVSDHLLLPKGAYPQYTNYTEALTTLGYLAGLTQKIKLGISTLVLPARHPIEVAKMLTTIQFLSERLIITFGLGWNEQEFMFLNQNFKNRVSRMHEGLTIIKSLFTGQDSFSGKYYSYNNADFTPKPDMKKVPFWIAGDSPAALKRALKYGTGWHPISSKLETLKNYLDQAKLPKNFAIALRLHVKEDQIKVLDEKIQSLQALGVSHLILSMKRSLTLLKETNSIEWLEKILMNN